MTTNVFTVILDEIEARLTAGKTANKIIAKDIFIGFFKENRKGNDLPVIKIVPTTGRNSPECPIQATDIFSFSIFYKANRLSDNNNKLYNTTDQKGLLIQLGHILNYIELKTSDATIDMGLNETTYDLMSYNWNIDYSEEDVMTLIINYTVKTGNYLRGAR